MAIKKANINDGSLKEWHDNKTENVRAFQWRLKLL